MSQTLWALLTTWLSIRTACPLTLYHADLKELVQPKMKNLSNWKAVFPEPVLL